MYADLSESAILLSQYQVPASSVPYPMENSQKQQQISYWDERSNPSYNRLHNQTDTRTHYEKLPQTIFLLFLPEHPICLQECHFHPHAQCLKQNAKHYTTANSPQQYIRCEGLQDAR